MWLKSPMDHQYWGDHRPGTGWKNPWIPVTCALRWASAEGTQSNGRWSAQAAYVPPQGCSGAWDLNDSRMKKKMFTSFSVVDLYEFETTWSHWFWMILDDFGMTAGDPSTIAAVSSCEMLSEMSGTRGQIWSNVAHQILAFWTCGWSRIA